MFPNGKGIDEDDGMLEIVGAVPVTPTAVPLKLEYGGTVAPTSDVEFPIGNGADGVGVPVSAPEIPVVYPIGAVPPVAVIVTVDPLNDGYGGAVALPSEVTPVPPGTLDDKAAVELFPYGPGEDENEGAAVPEAVYEVTVPVRGEVSLAPVPSGIVTLPVPIGYNPVPPDVEIAAVEELP